MIAKAQNTMPRVAFYCRISLDEEKQKFSLSAQEDRLEAFAKAHYSESWTRYKIYRDSASGTHLNRPELQQMLSDAQANAFDVLLVLRVDRLSRRVGELARLADELSAYGVALRSVTESFDTASPSGEMMFQMLGVMAEFEQKSIVSRTKMGMLKKAKTGAWPGGRVPLGYRFNAETGLEIQDDEALIIKKIFAKYTEGKDGSSTIARSLNDAGYRTKRGKKFNRKSILHILRNPFYVGKFRWQKEEFESDHKPIISLATFDEAKLILEKRSAESPGHKWHNQDQRLLSGLVYCKKCKSRMVAVSANAKGTKYSYYTCRRRLDTADCDQDSIRADLIEDQILSEIQTVFRDEALLDSIWKSAQKKLAANAPAIDKELKVLDKQRTKHQAALDRYFHAFETGSMAPATCSHRVEELSTQIKQLDEERVVLQEKRQSLDLPVIKNDFLQEILVNLKDVVDAVPTPQKKHLLHLLVKKVLVCDRRTFEVWYRLPQFPGFRTLGSMVAPKGLETPTIEKDSPSA